MNDEETKEAYHEAMRERQNLIKKTRKMGSDKSSSSDSDSDSSVDASKMKKKAMNKINDAMDESAEDE